LNGWFVYLFPSSPRVAASTMFDLKSNALTVRPMFWMVADKKRHLIHLSFAFFSSLAYPIDKSRKLAVLAEVALALARNR